MKSYEFIQYSSTMRLPDGIYNAKYNKEPAVIRIENCIPVFVSLIGFLNAENESRPSSIFHPEGILHSSVELLLPAQDIQLYKLQPII